MNQVQLMRKRNEVAQLIRPMNRHKDVLKWSPNETEAHISMKFEICKYLKQQGEEFYTEAIFADGSGRADVIAADRGLIIEVVDSEGAMSKLAKICKYPLPVIFVSAKQAFTEKLIQ